MMPSAMMSETVRPASSRELIDRQHGEDPFGRAHDPDENLGGDPQGSFRPDQEAREVGPRRIDGFPAQPDDLAVRQNRFDPEHMVAGHPVFQAVRAAGVFSQVSAQGGHLLAGGIRGVIISFGGEGVLQRQIVDGRFHEGALVLQIDFQDFVQAGKLDHYPAVQGNGPAA